MQKRETKKSLFLFLLLLFVMLTFGYLVFKNLGHPLLWNDEGDTVMRAKSVLDFGVPLVHYGGNVINQVEEGPGVGIKGESDIWIKMPWGQYYFGAIGVYLANFFDDFYTKTTIIRFPFAVAGLMGVFIFGLSIAQIFKDKIKKRLILIIFLFLEMTSVPLILNFRNARNYPLTLLILSLISYVVIRYGILKRLSYFFYFSTTVLLLVLLFFSFHPAFFASYGFLFFYTFVGLLLKREKNIKTFLKELAPYILVLILVIPLFSYFETFSTAFRVIEGENSGLTSYLMNLRLAFRFFTKVDFLILFLVLKVILFWVIRRNKINIKKYIRGIQSSLFFSVFFIFYVLFVARIPYFFERYFVPAQPLLILSILTDIFLIVSIIKDSDFSRSSRLGSKISLALLIFYLSVFPFMARINYLFPYLKEINSYYQGPLDYIIGYISKNYEHSEKLVIATNYSEPVYMYYLGSRVTVGYVGNNLEEDSKIIPDIVILRKGRPNNVKILKGFIEKGDYQKVVLPVYDYQVNNIAELTIPLKHLFETKFAKKDGDKVVLYIRRNGNGYD